jgi:hypothetical protein
MIIKIFRQGQLSGSEHIQYLFNEDKHKGYKPQCVRGNPFITETITNSITNKNKYVAGVLSFDKGEMLDEQKQQELMTMFENFVAPFDDKSRVNFLWVRHQDKGRLELHFMTPRLDLQTGKAYNIHPDTKANEHLYNHMTKVFNYINDFKQVQPKSQIPVTYTESNFKFSVKLISDLREKRADYISKHYCEKKKTIYNKKITRTKGLKNGMGKRIKTGNIGNDRVATKSGNVSSNSVNTTRNTQSNNEFIDQQFRHNHEREQPQERILSIDEHDFKPQKIDESKPIDTDSRSSTQKADSIRSSSLIVQVQELTALVNSEKNLFKRLQLEARLTQLRYQLEIEENAKKIQEENRKKLVIK